MEASRRASGASQLAATRRMSGASQARESPLAAQEPAGFRRVSGVSRAPSAGRRASGLSQAGAPQVKKPMDPLELERIKIEERRKRAEERNAYMADPAAAARASNLNIKKDMAAQAEEKAAVAAQGVADREAYDQEQQEIQDMVGECEAQKAANKYEETQAMLQFHQEQVKERRRMEAAMVAQDEANAALPGMFDAFQGEDPEFAQREALNKQQQRQWLQEQNAATAERSRREREEHQGYENMQKRILDLQNQQAANAEGVSKQEWAEVREYNRQKALWQQEQRAREAEHERQQNEDEIRYALSGTFLNETVVGGRENFKGFSVEQRQQILDEQMYQIEERNARREAERRSDIAYDDQQSDIRRAMVLQDRERARAKQFDTQQLVKMRQNQAMERKARYDYLDKVVYAPEVSEDYYGQFGTSFR